VDTENWLPESLLNWYDPKKPGVDPAKVADMEWYGWTPDTAVKLCWRNWGTTVRVGPHPNLLSARFQAWEKNICEAMAPVVTQWLTELTPEQQRLFVGKRHGKHRVKRAECETWDGRASHVYGQDCTDIEAR